MSTSLERVHSVTDYVDGPIGGVADFNGTPHRYDAEFDDLNGEYSSVFRLKELPQDLFHLLMEDWEIWRRWETAFHAGQTTKETHPALPEDRARHVDLLREIAVLNNRWTTRVFRMRGEFHSLGSD